MRILVTGSSGHLGEALMRVLPEEGHEVIGLDVLDSPYTNMVGSVADRACVRRCVAGVDAVVHSATLHKPHVRSHQRTDFIAQTERRSRSRIPTFPDTENSSPPA